MNYTLTFACGATMTTKEPCQVGKSLMVYTSPHQGHQRPCLHGDKYLPMPCLWACPVSIRASGKKIKRGWFTPDDCSGPMCDMVKCNVAACQEDPS